MKLIIDIPDMIYKILNGDSSWGGLSVDYILHAVKDGTPLESQPTDAVENTRDCKTCKHSDNGKLAGTEECHECMWESNYEQQTCGYCVDRDDVLKLVVQYPHIIGNRYSGLMTDIKHLPPATPQPKVGRWIDTGCDGQYECSNCNCLWQDSEENPYSDWIEIAHYCPNCGSYNGGGEDEDSN